MASEKSLASLRAEAYKKRMAGPVAEPVKEKKSRVEKAAGPVVNILSALYGIDGARVECGENIIVGKKLNNKMTGSDPAKGVKKDAIITATVNGDKVSLTFGEGEKITF